MNTALDPTTEFRIENSKRKTPFWLNIAILIGSLLFTIFLIEVALRIKGFSYKLYPEKLEFGYPDFKTMESKYIQDNELFWTQKDYPQKIASLIESKPKIIYMGDSCTEFGTYDKTIEQIFRDKSPDKQVLMSRVGVAGWGSFQGRQQMERDVVRIKPTVATIYYGWNDHWIGFGIEDKNIAKFHTPFWAALDHLRVAQLGMKAYLSMGKKDRADVPQRVSVPDYRDNLIAMTEAAKKNGIIPMLITAPTSQVAGKEPEYLKGRFLTKLEDLIPLHQSYITQVREVAASEHVPLCDLYTMFKELPQRDLEMKYFKNSGIHLTAEGNVVLGKFIYKCFEDAGLIEKLTQ